MVLVFLGAEVDSSLFSYSLDFVLENFNDSNVLDGTELERYLGQLFVEGQRQLNSTQSDFLHAVNVTLVETNTCVTLPLNVQNCNSELLMLIMFYPFLARMVFKCPPPSLSPTQLLCHPILSNQRWRSRFNNNNSCKSRLSRPASVSPQPHITQSTSCTIVHCVFLYSCLQRRLCERWNMHDDHS